MVKDNSWTLQELTGPWVDTIENSACWKLIVMIGHSIRNPVPTVQGEILKANVALLYLDTGHEPSI